MNVYSYGLNNPLSFTDPLGLEATFGDILGAGARGAGKGARGMGGKGGWRGAAAAGAIGAAAEIYKECTKDPCPACNPPAGDKFNKVTHWVSHSQDPASGSHGCAQSTGSPVHWHYSVNDQNPTTCQCFKREHVFGGCGVAPP